MRRGEAVPLAAGLNVTWAGVAVTGHRDLIDTQTAWLRPELDRVLLKLAAEHGCTDAATGMALGADMEFGWSARFAKLTLHAHIPFPSQPDRWTQALQDEYRRLLAECATTTIYGRQYDVRWLFERNNGLLNFVEESRGILLAMWDGRRTGGTFDTVRKAARRGLPVLHLDPTAMGRAHGPGCPHVRALTPPASQEALFD